MSAVSSARQKKDHALNKKIPENPKYKHVRATVDTGNSISKYLERMEEMKKDYKFRNDEIFKRMKITTLVQLMSQISEFETEQNGKPIDVDGVRPNTADLEVQQICDSDVAPIESVRNDGSESSRSTLQQVIKGVGEIDIDRPPPPPRISFVDDTCPYLLLDMRDADAYDQCHIITAKNYPRPMLSRSVNYETKDLLKYKNCTGKIIVIYDEDERIAHGAATTFVQRGYDNVFMLSGGLKVAFKKFPEGLITGTPPLGVVEQKARKNPVMASQRHFYPEDMNKLEVYLNNVLGDNSIGSRLSRATMSSRNVSQQSSKSNMTLGSEIAHRPPFKL